MQNLTVATLTAALLAVFLVAAGCDGGAGGEGEGEGEGDAGEGEGDAGEGEGEGDAGEGEGEGDTHEPLPAELVAAFEAAATTCIGEFPFIEQIEPGSTADLAASFTAEFMGRLQVQANDAFVTIDADAVAACIADLQDPTCFNGVPAEIEADSCSRVLVGILHDGDACEDGVECASLDCSFTTCTCVGDAPTSDIIDVDALPCLAEFDCPVGQTCHFDEAATTLTAACVAACGSDADCASTEHCTQNECAPLGAVDEFCSDAADCQAGLACVENVCATPKTVGSTCSFDCGDPTLFCDFNTSTCAARIADGGSCANALGGCQTGLTCDDTGHCSPAPGDGQPCAVSDGTCAVGFTCSFDVNPNGVCAALAAVGGACQDGTQCASGTCDQNRGVCVNDVVAALGEDCSTSLCGGGLLCAVETAGDFCRERVSGRAENDACTAGVSQTCPIGLVCSADSVCVPVTIETGAGACSTDFAKGPICSDSFTQRECQTVGGDVTGTCADRPGLGEPCTGNCISGFVCAPDINGGDATCVAASAAGGPCGAAGTGCTADLVCDVDTCRAVTDVQGGIGAECSQEGG